MHQYMTAVTNRGHLFVSGAPNTAVASAGHPASGSDSSQHCWDEATGLGEEGS